MGKEGSDSELVKTEVFLRSQPPLVFKGEGGLESQTLKSHVSKAVVTGHDGGMLGRRTRLSWEYVGARQEAFEGW